MLFAVGICASVELALVGQVVDGVVIRIDGLASQRDRLVLDGLRDLRRGHVGVERMSRHLTIVAHDALKVDFGGASRVDGAHGVDNHDVVHAALRRLHVVLRIPSWRVRQFLHEKQVQLASQCRVERVELCVQVVVG